MTEKIPQTILESVETIPLPPLPQALIRFLTLAENDRTLMADAASLVAQDPALTAHLLTVANSPPFRKNPATYSLKPCLDAIGPRMLRTLAASISVQNVFAPRIDQRNFDYTGFWLHSLRVAELSRSLAVSVHYPDAEEAYLAGLLHDIGQLLLVSGAVEGYGFPGGTFSNGAGPTARQHVLDAGEHAVVGSRLVEQWSLSSFMADAVLFHLHPIEKISSADLLSRIVWSAHNLSGRDMQDDALQIPSSDISVITSLVGIDAAGISEACRHTSNRVTEIAGTLGVDLSRAGQKSPGSSITEHELPCSQRYDENVAQLHLEAQVRTMAVMQPLQQSLLSLSDEAEVYGALRESARILFGLGRPAFLVLHPGKPILTGADIEGQSHLLTRLEIQPDSRQCLAASALRENRPRSSYDDDSPQPPSLHDIQIGRILRSEGILCIPMSNSERPIGVMVFGLTANGCTRTRGSRDWMTAFASVGARTMETFQMLRDRSQVIAAELTRHYVQRARKVVHEVVNPLGIIKNYLNIVSQKLGDETEVGRELDILKEEITRVERIIRRQADHSEHLPAVETVNVNSVIEGMLSLYGESLFDACGIEIDKQLAPELTFAKADRDSLKQILLNLWKNSAEAMQDGGRFSITTRVAAGDTDCGTVEIELVDTGPGIPPDVMDCLFQPLDPDRRPAHSGVGLSIVASLVERLGGTITCQSSTGNGTGFTIRLPQA